MSSKLIQVIHTEMPRGVGTKEDPCRIVHQYYRPDGLLLAEVDSQEKNREDLLKRLEVSESNCKYWEDSADAFGKEVVALEKRVKELEAVLLKRVVSEAAKPPLSPQGEGPNPSNPGVTQEGAQEPAAKEGEGGADAAR